MAYYGLYYGTVLVVADILLYPKSTGSAETVEFSRRTSDMPLKYDFCPQKSVSCAFVKLAPGLLNRRKIF